MKYVRIALDINVDHNGKIVALHVSDPSYFLSDIKSNKKKIKAVIYLAKKYIPPLKVVKLVHGGKLSVL